MSRQNTEYWKRVRRARDKLISQFLTHPDVTLIDIGYSKNRGPKTQSVTLRIHVRERWLKAKPEERVALPDHQDGIPVVVIGGEYRVGQ